MSTIIGWKIKGANRCKKVATKEFNNTRERCLAVVALTCSISVPQTLVQPLNMLCGDIFTIYSLKISTEIKVSFTSMAYHLGFSTRCSTMWMD